MRVAGVTATQRFEDTPGGTLMVIADPEEFKMCRAVKCRTCGKTTWAGCGQHVAQVKQAVPAEQWCGGHPKAEGGGGFFARLFGR